ncbi:MAG: hypothetical protein BGP06_16235 [Rhizobiales bacterium 65-9]|nr:DUF3750 domain-containing protein [Hyphomicrobiales bacterium]OJY38014.1 MAG: hypothetical protein BGP06_16235 [Rhizobiales bacterium 65-9]
MRLVKPFLIFFAIVYLAPLGLHAAMWMAQDRETEWGRVDWSSAELLPPAELSEPAAIYVFAGRVARSPGIFAHHHWIVLKDRGAARYQRYDVTRWAGLRENGWAPDGRWFGDTPVIVGKLTGAAAETALPRVRAAIANYDARRRDDYVLWPGPNSNSFVNAVVAAMPEARIAMLPTGIGKDFRGDGLFAGATPSRTGLQISAEGLLGFSVGWVEGVELNILGLVAGVDLRRPALKLPGFGRIGAGPV